MWITLGAIFQENLVVNIYLNWQDLVWIRDYGDQEHWPAPPAMVSTPGPDTQLGTTLCEFQILTIIAELSFVYVFREIST